MDPIASLQDDKAKGDPGKTYEASAATKCLHFGMAEPKGVALAQQVREDSAKSYTSTVMARLHLSLIDRF